MISRPAIIAVHVALIPGARFGIGVCVGSATVARGGILSSAVGVDIGCGMIAVETSVRLEQIGTKTAPHGAGRILGRCAAKREPDLTEFKVQMADRAWLDRDAEELLNEAHVAYEPIEQVMKDAGPLVDTVEVLSQFINYHGF